MQKNEIYEVYIEDIGAEGEGIGHIDGMAVFIKDAVMGDKVRAKIVKVNKKLAYARVEEIIEPSEYRVAPRCEKARACGGCTLQHMDYKAQLSFKWNKVKNCLERIGGFTGIEKLMEEPHGMENPFEYRNKMQFPVGIDKEGKVALGFYAGRTHSLIPLSKCDIGHPVNETIIRIIKDFCEKFNISIYDEENHKGLLRHVLTRVGFVTGEVMVCLVINGDKIKYADVLTDMLKNEVPGFASLMININKENTNKILGFESKSIYGPGYITDYIGDIAFHISPNSFYQVNPVQTKKLYEKALEYASLSGNEIVWDMYCGIGTISLFLAKSAKKVFGVEIVPQAIEDAKNNAALNNIENAEFYVGKAEDVVPEIFDKGLDGSKCDVVVVDPPRKGCDEKLLETICKMKPERLVYVSCDPATLARDLKYLCKEKEIFEVEKVAVYDQFPGSVHVESVVAMTRK